MIPSRRGMALPLLIVATLSVSAQSVRVVTEQFPPYSFQREGVVGGIGVEVMQAVLSDAEITSSIEVLPWWRAYRLARSRRGVLFFSVGRTPEREGHFQWIGPLVPYSVALYAGPQVALPPVSRLLDVAHLRMGVVEGDLRDQHLSRSGEFNLIRFSSSENLLQALYQGEVDVAPISELNVPYFLDFLNLDPEKLRKVYDAPELSHHGLYLVTGVQTDEHMVQRVRESLLRVQGSGLVEELLERYTER